MRCLWRKKKRWEFRKEVINKKLEISCKWQELRKEQSNKKYELAPDCNYPHLHSSP